MNFNSDITIAIPVYERYDYFEEAVDSAINQSLKCNVIVVDNCSSHNKFADYVARKSLSNVKYFRNEQNLGAIGNWNQCINIPNSKWVTILHSDDMLAANYVEAISKVISEHPNEAAILCADETGEMPSTIFNSIGEIKYSKRLAPFNFLFGNHAGFPGNIFNKAVIGNIRFRDFKGASDYAFWHELSLIKPLLRISNVLAFYRQSKEQDSATMNIDEVVITPTYVYRRDYIRFRNSFIKLLSMYELFQLYRYYQKSYGRKEEAAFNLSIQEVNDYFTLLNMGFAKIMLAPILRCMIYLIKSIL